MQKIDYKNLVYLKKNQFYYKIKIKKNKYFLIF